MLGTRHTPLMIIKNKEAYQLAVTEAVRELFRPGIDPNQYRSHRMRTFWIHAPQGYRLNFAEGAN